MAPIAHRSKSIEVGHSRLCWPELMQMSRAPL